MNPATNPEDNAERRESVLYKMKQLGFCTEEQYNEAMADTLHFTYNLCNRIGFVSASKYLVFQQLLCNCTCTGLKFSCKQQFYCGTVQMK